MKDDGEIFLQLNVFYILGSSPAKNYLGHTEH